MVEDNQNIEITAKDDVQLVFTVREDGEIRSVAGVTPRWVIARDYGDQPVVTTDDADASAAVTDGTNGEITVTIEDTATEDLAGDYVHELEIVDVTGHTVTVARGSLYIHPDTA